MIGVDTNILLRAALNDDPIQSPVARKLLGGLGNDHRALISIPVLMEYFWALRSRYRVPPTRLALAVRDLLEANTFEIEDLEAVGTALALYEAGDGAFADAVIALHNRNLGAEATYTFDRGAAKAVPAMELLS